MDIETSHAIESLRADIGRVETTLQAEIGKLRAEMVTRGMLKGEIASLRDDMVTRGMLKSEMASLRDELKRHTDIRFEALRDDIRLLADGFAFLSAKIDNRGQ